MALSISELQQFKDMQAEVARLSNQVRTLTDRSNEHHGTISYLKGLLKVQKQPKTTEKAE